jgi:hypothetical protein
VNAPHNAKAASHRTGLPATLAPARRRFGLAVPTLFVVVALAALAIAPTGAAAAAPESFWTRCAADVAGDASCNVPRGVATAPADAGPGIAGNVFVGDQGNKRIVEFTAWGIFERAWGWDVVASGPDDNGTGFEICVPADGDVCKAGTGGAGAGQFGSTQGVAVDSVGDVYVVDGGLPSNNRVQKFDPEGHFLRMWGGEVNTGTSGNPNVCTNAGPPTDVCRAGSTGSANGQFGELSFVGSYIAIDTLGTPSAADDKVYVGDQERIQSFDVNGTYQSQIAIPGEKVRALAVDPSGNLYASFCGAGCGFNQAAKANVRKLSPAGVELATIAVANPEALATGPGGELFVVDGNLNPTIREFTPAGVEVPGFAFTDGFSSSTGIATGSACLSAGHGLYVSNADFANRFIRAYGPLPDNLALCPPPPDAPEITDQGTLSVESDRATVQASINPKFWADTAYYVQYATAACIKAGGWGAACVTKKPTSPTQLGAGATSLAVKTAKIALTGLTPETKYTYRFVAESSGGGPVFGKGGTEAIEGEATSFTTTAIFAAGGEESCANAIFRAGPSAALPDCRAYEMVSPVDKNGGDIERRGLDGYNQASLDGNRLTYTAAPAFAEPSSRVLNQYLATRQEGVGWTDRGINAPLGRQLGGVLAITREIGAFSADLCSEWLEDYNLTPLTADAQPGYKNLYRQDLCGGGFEALTTTVPSPDADPQGYVNADSIQGIAADTGEVFFTAEAGLTPDAVQNGVNAQVYERSGGELHLISVLRSGAADPGSTGKGTLTGAAVGGGIAGDTGANLEHAVADDGSRVYWTSQILYSGAAGGQLGKLYLRENPAQPQSALAHGGAGGTGDLSFSGATVTNVATSFGAFVAGQTIVGAAIPPETTIVGVNPAEHKLTLSAAASAKATGSSLEAFSECTEADKACTMEVSTGPSEERMNFWGADPSGSQALYSEGVLEDEATGQSAATLYRFDAETETRTPVAAHFRGMLGASRDLSHIYFVSTAALTGAQKNGEDDEALDGKPNLYLDREGTLTFIATLSGGPHGDVFRERGDGDVYNVASFNPRFRTARVTPDGKRVLFQSRAPLTHYDNTDANSGQPDIEVFTYEAGGALQCVSCNPSGARPDGEERPRAFVAAKEGVVWGAAWILPAERALHSSNMLSKDGRRLFFLAKEALVPHDTNGVQDVYEWEVPGAGGCNEESPAFRKASGGCIYLISSGESPFRSEFWDASPDGRDVFFTTESSLLPQDPGHVDVYDARAGGGFAQPGQLPACEGESCQSAGPPPVDQTLSSASFKGAGNLKPKPSKRCAKGKRQVRKAGKTRCVARHAKHRHKHKRGTDDNRRTAR